MIVIGSSESMHAQESVGAYVLKALGFDLSDGNTWDSVCTLQNMSDGNYLKAPETPYGYATCIRIKLTGKNNGANLLSLTIDTKEMPNCFWEKIKSVIAEAIDEGTLQPRGAVAIARCLSDARAETVTLDCKTVYAEPAKQTYTEEEWLEKRSAWSKALTNHFGRAESFTLDSLDLDDCAE